MVDDPIAEFVTECLENLDRFEQAMLTLERDPAARAVLDDMFRSIHTIKGSSGFFDFNAVARISHAGENLLSAIREGRMTASSSGISALLEMSDVLRRLLSGGLQLGREPESDDADLVRRLVQALADGLRASTETDAAEIPRSDQGEATLEPACPFDAQHDVPSAADTHDAHAPAARTPAPAAVAAPPDAADRTLRVDVEVIDRLMDIAGEIVLARNQILRLAAATADPAYLAAAQRLNVITSELQERVMKTRMQPIGTVWSKFPRLVRDVAKQCSKQVRLDFTGGETELDKSVVESIKDPLTHLIRNCIDHGIESAPGRVAAGKPAEGAIAMRAYAEGGQVIIEVADDGGGIDPERVLRRAVERGVLGAEEAARMSEREILGLIFRPGFSTAETVSTVSGRGVGMDVVKTNLEKLGGVVDVESKLGLGTTVRLTIPLTLAIVPALIVACDRSRYAIPQSSLVELVSIRPGDAEHRIESIHESIVFRLRGNLIPIIDLARELAVTPVRRADGAVNVAVLEVGAGRFGVILDEISDTVEIVVKPLAAQLQSIALFAGATILGDGSVALILDMPELARRAALHAQGHGREVPAVTSRAESIHHRAAVVALLSSGAQMAIPMDQITRLERIPRSRMEWGDGRRIVQYRGTLLWCMDLGEQLGAGYTEEDLSREMVDMIVVEAGRQTIGLVVQQVLDVVDLDVSAVTPSSRPSYIGTTVVFGRVTDLVDLNSLLAGLGLQGDTSYAA